MPAPLRLGLLVLGIPLLHAGCDRDPVDGGSRPELQGKPGSGTGDPTVDSANPAAATQDTTLDVQVAGTGFDRGSSAEWAIDGVTAAKVRTNSTRYVSSTQLVANITIAADADTTLYDVVVLTSRGKKGIGTEIFTVTSGSGKPRSNLQPFLLQVSGDLVIDSVRVMADPDPALLWNTVHPQHRVTLQISPRLRDYFAPADELDRFEQFSEISNGECSYTETTPARPNTYGLNAVDSFGNQRIWTDARLENVTPERFWILHDDPSARGKNPKSDLNVLVKESSSKLSNGGLALTFDTAQSMVGSSSPDPHTDPCVTFTVTAHPRY
jgi:hypothetical protein